ncbi:MAG: hypothetical protein IPP83_06130 [Flavobacteriales bacterium]|nr:hypothetical protein [Flavobacteriales bacterium]
MLQAVTPSGSGNYADTYLVNSVACGPATATLSVIVGPCLIPPGEIFPTE